MVGTHFADDRDHFESAMQRLREAFVDVRDGRRSPALAEDDFDEALRIVREIVGPLLVDRQLAPWSDPAAEEGTGSPSA